MEPIAQNNIAPTATLVTREVPDDLQLKQVDHDLKSTPSDNALLQDEMVIEEVSIDGMCGVY